MQNKVNLELSNECFIMDFQKSLIFFQGPAELLLFSPSVQHDFDGLERITSPGRKFSAVFCVTPISETTSAK